MKALNGVITLAALIIVTTAACHNNPGPPTPPPTHHTVIATPTPTVTTQPTPTVTATTSPSTGCKYRWQAGEPLPDPKCTPGAIQSSDTAAICTPGWSTAHRQYFTKAEREVAFAKYGVYTSNPAGYGEYDHLIPLELGGANSPDNLWPEPGKIPNVKDTIENEVHAQVCSGTISLHAAQQEFASDWVSIAVATSHPVTPKAAPRVAPAPPPPPAPAHSAPAAVSCYPTTSGGNCYSRGEYCPAKDRGSSGVAKNGTAISCQQDGKSWRWE